MGEMRLSPMLRWVLRVPAYLYDLHAGWILGQRFLRLTHTGRRSGRRYQTMLEVVGADGATGELIVVAGLGRSAQWYRNVRAGNATEIAIGRRRFHPRYRELAPDEASAALAD
jgi:deazaflavin-dependent oxidoreductase (nitroreductase family)